MAGGGGKGEFRNKEEKNPVLKVNLITRSQLVLKVSLMSCPSTSAKTLKAWAGVPSLRVVGPAKEGLMVPAVGGQEQRG